MAKNETDPILRAILGTNEPSGSIGGNTDNDFDPVGALIHRQVYGINPPASAPVRKTPSIEEIERRLTQRRQDRRKTLIEKHPTFVADARAQIRAALLEDRDAVVATGGDLGKLLGQ
jgi:hypothetical protein